MLSKKYIKQSVVLFTASILSVVLGAMKSKDIYPLMRVEFEGYEFPAPGNVDAYLRRLYGNYMQIPDVKQTHVKTIEFLK